jgi:hypothetical protein
MFPQIEELIRNRWITRQRVAALHKAIVTSGLVEQVADMLAETAEMESPKELKDSLEVAVVGAILGALAGDLLLSGQLEYLGGGRRRVR